MTKEPSKGNQSAVIQIWQKLLMSVVFTMTMIVLSIDALIALQFPEIRPLFEIEAWPQAVFWLLATLVGGLFTGRYFIMFLVRR